MLQEKKKSLRRPLSSLRKADLSSVYSYESFSVWRIKPTNWKRKKVKFKWRSDRHPLLSVFDSQESGLEKGRMKADYIYCMLHFLCQISTLKRFNNNDNNNNNLRAATRWTSEFAGSPPLWVFKHRRCPAEHLAIKTRWSVFILCHIKHSMRRPVDLFSQVLI